MTTLLALYEFTFREVGRCITMPRIDHIRNMFWCHTAVTRWTATPNGFLVLQRRYSSKTDYSRVTGGCTASFPDAILSIRSSRSRMTILRFWVQLSPVLRCAMSAPEAVSSFQQKKKKNFTRLFNATLYDGECPAVWRHFVRRRIWYALSDQQSSSRGLGGGPPPLNPSVCAGAAAQ